MTAHRATPLAQVFFGMSLGEEAETQGIYCEPHARSDRPLVAPAGQSISQVASRTPSHQHEYE